MPWTLVRGLTTQLTTIELTTIQLTMLEVSLQSCHQGGVQGLRCRAQARRRAQPARPRRVHEGAPRARPERGRGNPGPAVRPGAVRWGLARIGTPYRALLNQFHCSTCSFTGLSCNHTFSVAGSESLSRERDLR